MKRHLIKLFSALLISIGAYGIFYLIFSFSADAALIQAITAFITLLALEYLMPLVSRTAKLLPGDHKDFRPIKLRWGKRLNQDDKSKN